MIVIAGALLGATIGALTAKKRNGNGLDMLQYGAGYALAFTVVGMIITVAIDRAVSL